MMKLGEIRVEQEETCGEIMIEGWKRRMEIEKLQSAIEAILFTMGDSVEISKLAFAIGHDEETTKKLVRNMMERYEKEDKRNPYY